MTWLSFVLVGVAEAGLCPSGASFLDAAGPNAFTLVCDTADSATGCWEPPAGACATTNVVTVSVDGAQIYQETWPGTGGRTCTTGFPVIGHEFSVGAVHTVQTTTSSTSGSFTVTVLPGPACDGDADDVFDVQDNCLGLANPDQTDTDLDGEGDACDVDDDGDTCVDRADDDPLEGQVVIGSRLAVNCPDPSVAVYGSASDDVDGDGLPACADPDDDGDGTLDEDDPCPAHAYETAVSCQYPPISCPLQHWWDVCLFGGCNELLLRWVSVINPDPNVYFDEIDVVGGAVVIGAQRDRTLDQVRDTLLDDRAGTATLEVWTKDRTGAPEALLAVIGAYDARAVAEYEGAGGALALTFDARGALEAVQAVSH